MQNVTKWHRCLSLSHSLSHSLCLFVHFAEKFSLINYYLHFANLPYTHPHTYTHSLVKSVHRRTNFKNGHKNFRILSELPEKEQIILVLLMLLMLPPTRCDGVAYVCQKLIKNSLQIHTQQVALPLPAGSQVGPRYPTEAERQQNGCRVR